MTKAQSSTAPGDTAPGDTGPSDTAPTGAIHTGFIPASATVRIWCASCTEVTIPLDAISSITISDDHLALLQRMVDHYLRAVRASAASTVNEDERRALHEEERLAHSLHDQLYLRDARSNTDPLVEAKASHGTGDVTL
jgi:hypothetical protein